MLKKIINAVNILLIPVKIGILGAIVFYSYSYLNTVFINEEVEYGTMYRSLPEDSIDVLVLGSSQAQYSFNPAFFYQDTGLYSYVLGSACQPLEVSYQMLKEGLKTQSPKLVVLEVFTALPLRCVCEADSSYIIAQYQMRDEEKYNTINYLSPDKAKTYYNEFLVYHNQWKNLTSLDEIKPSEKLLVDPSRIDNYFGYAYLEPTLAENSWYAETHSSELDVKLDKTDEEALNNIYELCQENGISLLLYKTPIDGTDEENHSYLRKVFEWAESKNIHYVNFFDKSEELDYRMWTHSDSYHAYINGAEIITKALAEEIANNYEFKHNSNQLLDELYTKSGRGDILSFVKVEKKPEQILSRLEKYEGDIIISYIPKDELSLEVIESLKVITHEGFEPSQKYFGVITQKEVQHQSNEYSSTYFNGEEILFDEQECIIAGKSFSTEGLTLIFDDPGKEKIVLTDILSNEMN